MNLKQTIPKVIGYIAFRYCLFYIFLFLGTNAKTPTASDLRNKEDFFMIGWLFLLPLIVEIAAFSIPLAYGLAKIVVQSTKWIYYVLLGILFAIEFILYNNVFGILYPFVKVGISLVVFFGLFRKRFFIDHDPH